VSYRAKVNSIVFYVRIELVAEARRLLQVLSSV
jgi:hypothetical protein